MGTERHGEEKRRREGGKETLRDGIGVAKAADRYDSCKTSIQDGKEVVMRLFQTVALLSVLVFFAGVNGFASAD